MTFWDGLTLVLAMVALAAILEFLYLILRPLKSQSPYVVDQRNQRVSGDLTGGVHSVRNKMGKLVINGVEIEGDVQNIQVKNGQVILDGKDFTGQVNAQGSNILEVRITEGWVNHVMADGAVNCKEVHGDVDAGGSVNCGNVGGDVDAGGSVNCGKVSGSIDAGGSVRHG
jgi:hypothetical protein